MRAIAYGGGVQSTAMVILAVEGRIDADVALFANVGEQAEHPATLAYVRDIAQPWAAARGFDVLELHREATGKAPADLYEAAVNDETGAWFIPTYSPQGSPMRRLCTNQWKVAVLKRWLRDKRPATSLIGISVDEIERASRGYDAENDAMGYGRAYPLLELGLHRRDCEELIRAAGLPIPRKSACYFCPYKRPATWAEMARDEPELFARAQQLEDAIIAKRAARGRDPVFLTRFGRRLTEAIQPAQDPLPLFIVLDERQSDIGEAGCDEGVCFV